MTAVCEQIRKALAPAAKKVNAELYKLLIYREGDFFNQHQDAQHSARNFASLLFLLPVKYTGGEFNMYGLTRYGSNKVTIEDEKTAEGCSWVAFYTDIHHNVDKVTGGFRVVLNYQLTFEGEMSPSPLLPLLNQPAIEIFRNYFKVFDKRRLAIPLSYQYTQATLSPSFLKGIDAYVFNAIDKIAFPEMQFVLRFDKTKVIPPTYVPGYDYFDYESDHEQVFQGIFTVDHEIVKRCFEIDSRSQREIADTSDRAAHHELRMKRGGEYAALMEEVKASQKDIEIEWIVERKESGEPKGGSPVDLYFDIGQVGWLGNMSPS